MSYVLEMLATYALLARLVIIMNLVFILIYLDLNARLLQTAPKAVRSLSNFTRGHSLRGHIKQDICHDFPKKLFVVCFFFFFFFSQLLKVWFSVGNSNCLYYGPQMLNGIWAMDWKIFQWRNLIWIAENTIEVQIQQEKGTKLWWTDQSGSSFVMTHF